MEFWSRLLGSPVAFMRWQAFGRKERPIGVDIGTSSVKLVDLSHDTSEGLPRWRLQGADRVTLPADVLDADGTVRDVPALAFLGIPARGAAASSGAALGPLVAMSAGSAGPLAAIPAPFAGTSETLPTPARNLFDQKSLATALGLPRAAPAARSGGGPDLSRRREPLEAHDLRDLRVVGVLQSEQQRIAIVEAAGAHHSVSAGQYLGRRHGRVQHISDGGLELVEWQQHAGHWRRVTVRLRIDTRATRGPGHPAGDLLDE